jgi:hypothetical protein
LEGVMRALKKSSILFPHARAVRVVSITGRSVAIAQYAHLVAREIRQRSDAVLRAVLGSHQAARRVIAVRVELRLTGGGPASERVSESSRRRGAHRHEVDASVVLGRTVFDREISGRVIVMTYA